MDEAPVTQMTAVLLCHRLSGGVVQSKIMSKPVMPTPVLHYSAEAQVTSPSDKEMSC